MICFRYSRRGVSSVPSRIVRNFSSVNSCISIPQCRCRKKTGPGESRRMSNAITAIKGPVRRSDRPKERLSRRDEREMRAGAALSSALPSIQPSILDLRLRTAWVQGRSERRDFERTDQLAASVRVDLGRTPRHAVDVLSFDDLDDLIRLLRSRTSARLRAISFGAASTKPSRLIPHSGCCKSLRPISCPTSPAPTTTVF